MPVKPLKRSHDQNGNTVVPKRSRRNFAAAIMLSPQHGLKWPKRTIEDVPFECLYQIIDNLTDAKDLLNVSKLGPSYREAALLSASRCSRLALVIKISDYHHRPKHDFHYTCSFFQNSLRDLTIDFSEGTNIPDNGSAPFLSYHQSEALNRLIINAPLLTKLRLRNTPIGRPFLFGPQLMQRIEELRLDNFTRDDSLVQQLLYISPPGRLRLLGLYNMHLRGPFLRGIYHTQLRHLHLSGMSLLDMQYVNEYLFARQWLDDLQVIIHAEPTNAKRLAPAMIDTGELRPNYLQNLRTLTLASLPDNQLLPSLVPLARFVNLQHLSITWASPMDSLIGWVLALPLNCSLRFLRILVESMPPLDIGEEGAVAAQLAWRLPNLETLEFIAEDGDQAVTPFLSGLLGNAKAMPKLRALRTGSNMLNGRLPLAASVWASLAQRPALRLLQADMPVSSGQMLPIEEMAQMHGLTCMHLDMRPTYENDKQAVRVLGMRNEGVMYNRRHNAVMQEWWPTLADRLPVPQLEVTVFGVLDLGQVAVPMARRWKRLHKLTLYGHVALGTLNALLGQLPNLREFRNYGCSRVVLAQAELWRRRRPAVRMTFVESVNPRES